MTLSGMGLAQASTRKTSVNGIATIVLAAPAIIPGLTQFSAPLSWKQSGREVPWLAAEVG